MSYVPNFQVHPIEQQLFSRSQGSNPPINYLVYPQVNPYNQPYHQQIEQPPLQSRELDTF